MKIKDLSATQKNAWISGGVVYGIILIVIAYTVNGDWNDEDLSRATILVFTLSWLAGVIGLRIYIQDIKNPEDWKGFLKK